MQLIFLSLLTLAVLLLAGGYYTFASAAVSAVLLVYLAARMITSGTFRIRRSLITLALFVFCLMHFLVYFWAVDPSMAFKGGVKFLPVFFLWLVLGFLEPDQKEKWLGLFPSYGAVLTLISMGMTLFPAGRELVLIEGRLGGTFQYPNTFAIFLLVCAVIELFRVYALFDNARSGDQAQSGELLTLLLGLGKITICVAGIALSGSRTVYLLTFAVIVIGILYLVWDRSRSGKKIPDADDDPEGHKPERLVVQAGRPTSERTVAQADRQTSEGSAIQTGRRMPERPTAQAGKRKLYVTVGIIVSLLVLVLLLIFTGAGSLILERIAAISTRSSTLLGRILYLRDAFPIIADHPAGLGFYGYRFIQGVYQTGNYAVVNVHNEPVQLLLDIGVLPGILFLAAVLTAFFRSSMNLRNKVLIVLLLAHSMLDYDFHFLAIWFLFLLLLPSDANLVLCFRSGAREIAGKTGAGTRTKTAGEITTKAESRPAASVNAGPTARTVTVVLVGLVAIGTIYSGVRVGMSDLFYITGNNGASQTWYPNTVTALNLLAENWHSAKEREELADQVLAEDTYVSAAYAVKAQQAIEAGSAVDMAVYQKAAIKTNPYRFGLYTDYLEMLHQSQEIYVESGDLESAHVCTALAQEIPDLLKQVEERTSSLGWKLSVKPTVKLDETYQKVLDEMGQY